MSLLPGVYRDLVLVCPVSSAFPALTEKVECNRAFMWIHSGYFQEMSTPLDVTSTDNKAIIPVMSVSADIMRLLISYMEQRVDILASGFLTKDQLVAIAQAMIFLKFKTAELKRRVVESLSSQLASVEDYNLCSSLADLKGIEAILIRKFLLKLFDTEIFRGISLTNQNLITWIPHLPSVDKKISHLFERCCNIGSVDIDYQEIAKTFTVDETRVILSNILRSYHRKEKLIPEDFKILLFDVVLIRNTSPKAISHLIGDEVSQQLLTQPGLTKTKTNGRDTGRDMAAGAGFRPRPY